MTSENPKTDDPHSDAGFSSSTAHSDGTLLQRYRKGDEDAATELYTKYAERLRILARIQSSTDLKTRIDSDDVVQSIFRTFFRRVSNGQYDVPQGEELWKLLLVIAMNKIRSLAAHHGALKRSVSKTVSATEEFQIGASSQVSSGGSEFQILKLTIDELLSKLPEPYQEIIHLRIACHEVQEIATMTNKSKRTVERILQTFCKKLNEQI